MGWIKRNLLFFISGLVAVLFLGGAGYYDFRSWSHNSATFDQLNQIYDTLQQLNSQKPSPGNKKIDNIKTAKEQEAVVKDWISQTGKYFKPIAPIPNSTNVTSEAFAGGLRRTIDQLQHEAQDASVLLPPKYAFSFEAERSLVMFPPESLQPLAAELGEVKAISEVLFASHVNSLDSIQRTRVSDDATGVGGQNDYVNDVAVTNAASILTPYELTFRGFSGEIASVLAGLASSPYSIVVKGMSVQQAAAAGTPETGAPGQFYPQPQTPVPGAGMMPGRRGELPTVLNEQLLRITLEVMIVKPMSLK